MAEDVEFEPEHEAQPLVEHLIELRDRLVRCVVVVLAVFLSLIYFAKDIYSFVAAPLSNALGVDGSLIAIDPTATFLTPFKLTFFVSVFITMPFLLYQLWSFIAPALYKKEKKLAIPIFASSIALFYLGIAFAYFVVFPLIFQFFTLITPDSVILSPDITTYLNLAIKLFFAFGIAFEIPIATVILILAGVMSPDSLAQKRGYVIVTCFVIGMFLTPPDMFSQIMLAVPMWALFEVGIFFGRLATKDRPKEEDASA